MWLTRDTFGRLRVRRRETGFCHVSYARCSYCEYLLLFCLVVLVIHGGSRTWMFHVVRLAMIKRPKRQNNINWWYIVGILLVTLLFVLLLLGILPIQLMRILYLVTLLSIDFGAITVAYLHWRSGNKKETNISICIAVVGVFLTLIYLIQY
jgi:hypothetical protein